MRIGVKQVAIGLLIVVGGWVILEARKGNNVIFDLIGKMTGNIGDIPYIPFL